MIRRTIRSFGRRTRRYVQPLVGQPQLRELLEEQRSLVTAQGAALKALQVYVSASEASIGQRLDVLRADYEADPPLTVREFKAALSTEIARLDGHLVYQSDETRRAIAVGPPPQRPRLVIPTGRDLDAIFVSEVFDFVVPTREEGLLAFLLRHGAEAIEPGVRAVLAAHLRPGDVAVDVGASIGLRAVGMAAAVGPEGRVVCVEPLPHLAAALKRTLRLNGFAERSEVLVAALSDENGTAELFTAAHSPLSSLFPLPPDIAGDLLEVPLRRLDDVLPEGSRVDVVKLDVEGAEPRVWGGMRRVRAENHRLVIVLEWSASHFARSGESAADFMREILADGFNAAMIDDDEPGRVVPVGVDQAVNIEAGNLILIRGF